MRMDLSATSAVPESIPCKDGHSTTSLFQCIAPLSEKERFLMYCEERAEKAPAFTSLLCSSMAPVGGSWHRSSHPVLGAEVSCASKAPVCSMHCMQCLRCCYF